ncbi:MULTISPECIES: lysozyme inhibitor LprI family protein [Luteibacter]|uniref:lysozyme inhibitor LprI family protein n=1 Tax=Luteibacter TaxID=242605 RepID=UPI000689A472|nr:MULTISPECIES: lysozyme inhibitor LprI family protein [unclassified Luteibacter]
MHQGTRVWTSVALGMLFMSDSARSQMTLPPDPTLVARNAELRLRPSYQQCIDASMAATPLLLECSSNEFAFQDGRLNDAYKKLRASLNEQQRLKLRDEEREWLAGKKIQCSSGEEPGQGDLIVSATCEVVETAKRANELINRLK